MKTKKKTSRLNANVIKTVIIQKLLQKYINILLLKNKSKIIHIVPILCLY